MIIDKIRNFIRQCPYLQEFNGAIKVNVDYLDGEPTVYSIEEVPAEPILKRYIDGSTRRQYNFIFTSRESYGPDVLQNIANSGFYEDFAQWLEECSDNDNLPVLGDGKEALKIEATTTGYAFQTDENSARYQIQARLIYNQGR
ncbi:chloramphenicol resistance protein [Clostridium tyrobutyricum]|uniref:chloramphenicol resistance protein n=1 Tax=Clostridium tyrobutyricum TaxID=1519 RepID=UPI0030CDA258